ncbi:MAG: V-type ATP synthase subunit E [Clostridiales bacterium]|nr:V-type ATP synthase subunit E [Clostridiales bacterium]
MTTEEKLKHFQDICMEDARERSARMLDDYMNALESAYEEHTADARRRADMQVEAETEKLEREINKRLSIGQLDLKREFSRRQEELKDKLFVELRDKLANFMETQEYQRLLDRQVKAVKEFAGNEELIVYMDPSDVDKVQRIALHHNASIKIGEYSFDGGTRAVIPGKHILIDNSFETKLNEARHEFKFDLGGK